MKRAAIWEDVVPCKKGKVWQQLCPTRHAEFAKILKRNRLDETPRSGKRGPISIRNKRKPGLSEMLEECSLSKRATTSRVQELKEKVVYNESEQDKEQAQEEVSHNTETFLFHLGEILKMMPGAKSYIHSTMDKKYKEFTRAASRQELRDMADDYKNEVERAEQLSSKMADFFKEQSNILAAALDNAVEMQRIMANDACWKPESIVVDSC